MRQITFVFGFFLVINFSLALDEISRGECLKRNESRTSKNSCYKLYFKNDGNVVIENVYTGEVTWTAETAGKSTTKACMQNDLNFVVYGDEGDGQVPYWASKTQGSWYNFRFASKKAKVTDDGQLELDISDVKRVFGNKVTCELESEKTLMGIIEKLTIENYKLKRKTKTEREQNTKEQEKLVEEISSHQQEYESLSFNATKYEKEYEKISQENENLSSEIKMLTNEKNHFFGISQKTDEIIKEFIVELEKLHNLKFSMDGSNYNK